MKPITETAFDFSGDCLGESVKHFVEAMAKSQAELQAMLGEGGYNDPLSDGLFNAKEAYVELFNHLLECGIKGREIALLQEWQIEAMKNKGAK